MSQPVVAIIIPFRAWDQWIEKCIERCAAQEYRSLECLLIPDRDLTPEQEAIARKYAFAGGLHILPSGPVNPARKRNLAMRASKADIFAFVDADAYPVETWLSTALPLLADDVLAVGGPNVTPEEDPVSRRIPGRVMQSVLGFGPAFIRHYPVPRRPVRELPTCNLISRRIDGLYFREELDTCEDMTYCAELIERGGKIIYDPGVLVYHHRRTLLKPFMQQFFAYGLDKSRILREGNEASYIWHAGPALFTLYVLALPVALFFLPAIVLLPLFIYALVATIESARAAKSPIEFLLTLLVFPVAHFSYGGGYLAGCFRRRSS